MHGVTVALDVEVVMLSVRGLSFGIVTKEGQGSCPKHGDGSRGVIREGDRSACANIFAQVTRDDNVNHP
jgi:hypothetical protein